MTKGNYLNLLSFQQLSRWVAQPREQPMHTLILLLPLLLLLLLLFLHMHGLALRNSTRAKSESHCMRLKIINPQVDRAIAPHVAQPVKLFLRIFITAISGDSGSLSMKTGFAIAAAVETSPRDVQTIKTRGCQQQNH